MGAVDASGNRHEPAGSSTGGRFAGRTSSAPTSELEETPTLSELAPSAIDDELAALYESDVVHVLAMARNERYLASSIARREKTTSESVLRDLDREIARLQASLEVAEKERAVLALRMRPFHDEFRRRGGWPRAFLVTGGHLHSGMSCSTCNRDGAVTRFAWMTELSGATEDEIVQAAGERACTVCFPSAPIDVLRRPSALLTPDERTAAEERIARAEARAAAAAAREAKAITQPDGRPLRHGYREARTLVTAERELVDAIETYELADSRGHTIRNREHVAEMLQWRDMLVEAIAAKTGVPADEVRASASVKAEKKFKRDYR